VGEIHDGRANARLGGLADPTEEFRAPELGGSGVVAELDRGDDSQPGQSGGSPVLILSG
jgi:hypothetical protein